MTEEQRKMIEYFDREERLLAIKLQRLLEERREYINTQQLNTKVNRND